MKKINALLTQWLQFVMTYTISFYWHWCRPYLRIPVDFECIHWFHCI